MSMETPEDGMAANNNNSSSSNHSHVVVKGKRTKRRRLRLFPAPAVTATSSASSSTGFSGSTTEEEEDMANCLILLAQGRASDAGRKLESSRLEEEGGGGGGEKSATEAAATTANGKAAGLYVHECKTCNKCFPSFQALGGHRASHKKPKTAAASAAAMEEKKAMGLQISIATFPNPITVRNSNKNATAIATNSSTNKSRVHECSICGSEFSSGQALGGHMRRHRAAIVPETTQEVKNKEKTILSLDLNLPAPSEDAVERGDFSKSPSFTFASKQPLTFSASALVDCHY